MAKIFVTNHFRKHLFKWGYTSHRIRAIIRAHQNEELGTVVPTRLSGPRQGVNNSPWYDNLGGFVRLANRVAVCPISVEVIK
jgi:hypothetical protein